MDGSRFAAFADVDALAKRPVVIVGCGNLGSWMAMMLVRYGFKQFVLIDPDNVEEANLGTQAYDNRHIGSSKVLALKGQIEDVAGAGAQVSAIEAKVEDVNEFAPGAASIVLAMTDNLESREFVAKKCQEDVPSLLVDCRMTFFHFSAFICKGKEEIDKHVSNFEKLRGGTTAVGPCGASSTGATGMAVAGMVSPWIVAAVQGSDYPRQAINGNALTGVNLPTKDIKYGDLERFAI